VIRCGKVAEHEGVEKYGRWEYDRDRMLAMGATPAEIEDWQAQGIIERRLRKMEAQQSTALAPYVGKAIITEEEAKRIIITVWPNAPKEEVVKAAIMCAQYKLNPLMGHVHLMKFRTRDGEQWSIVRGINADRLLASRGRRFSYIDDTPRIMTDEEQEKFLGEVDNSKIHAIVVLRDHEGNTYRGFGAWPREKEVMGADKGNSKANMAFIRAERQALHRAAPAELPTEGEVVDDAYLPDVSYDVEAEVHEVAAEVVEVEQAVDEDTGEIITEPAEEPAEKPKAKPKAKPANAITDQQINAMAKLLAVKFGLELAEVWTVVGYKDGKRELDACHIDVCNWLQERYNTANVTLLSQDEAGDAIQQLQGK
jgi:hypothetical protein